MSGGWEVKVGGGDWVLPYNRPPRVPSTEAGVGGGMHTQGCLFLRGGSRDPRNPSPTSGLGLLPTQELRSGQAALCP